MQAGWPCADPGKAFQLSLKQTLSKHSKGVTSGALSPGGGMPATGGGDGSVRIWDVATAEMRFQEGTHSGPVWGAGVQPGRCGSGERRCGRNGKDHMRPQVVVAHLPGPVSGRMNLRREVVMASGTKVRRAPPRLPGNRPTRPTEAHRRAARTYNAGRAAKGVIRQIQGSKERPPKSSCFRSLQTFHPKTRPIIARGADHLR